MIKDDVLKIFLYISLKIRKINALWGGENIPPPPPRHSYQLTHAALHQTICYVKCQPIKLNCPPGTPPSRHSPTKHNTFSRVYPSVIDSINIVEIEFFSPFSRSRREGVGGFLFVYIFGGLECVGHSFAYVTHFCIF